MLHRYVKCSAGKEPVPVNDLCLFIWMFVVVVDCVLFDTGFLCHSPGRPRTHSIVQVGLDLTEI